MYDLGKRLRSLRTSVRLSLQFSVLYAALSAFVFLGALWFTNLEVRDWATDQMKGDASKFAAIYEASGAEALQASITTLASFSYENARIYQLQVNADTVLAGNIVTVLDDSTGSFSPAATLELTTPIDDEVSGYWMRRDRIGPYTLFQGSGNHIVSEVVEAVGTALGVGYILVVGLGLLIGVLVGRVTERRIKKISDTLAHASQGDLSVRVPTDANESDDLSRISNGINSALDQLRRLLESQSQISNDIAHDLRTPLQRLRQRLEAMRDGDEAKLGGVEGALQQVDGIIATFNALLRIAQIEAQDRQARFCEVDLNDIVDGVVDLFGPAAEKALQSLTFIPTSTPALVQGDPSMLMQLFANLIENSLHHCPKGTSIEVNTRVSAGQIHVTVADDGPGISPENRERIFERFVRTDTSRTSSGNGLGLTLARAIAEMHGAAISVKDSETGAEFLVAFQR